MKRYLTKKDLTDVIHKFKQRGLGFVLSKLTFFGINRTKSSFNQLDYESADWWIIPKVNQRWNQLITGNKNEDYKEYFVKNFLKNKKGVRLISIGSGLSHHEIQLAKYSNFEEIVCIDVVSESMKHAEASAKKLNLKNITFVCADVNKHTIPKAYYDVVFFHALLHHFDNMETFVKSTIKDCLKPGGLLVINEYVGATRLQFPKKQLAAINEALKIIPNEYKTRCKSNLLKRKYYGSGIIRMILADPSECIDAKNIIPAIHSNFHVITEKSYGGNILMSVLKDISHHFVKLDSKKNQILEELFAFEDEYLTHNTSDFIFGVNQKAK